MATYKGQMIEWERKEHSRLPRQLKPVKNLSMYRNPSIQYIYKSLDKNFKSLHSRSEIQVVPNKLLLAHITTNSADRKGSIFPHISSRHISVVKTYLLSWSQQSD